MFWQAGQNSLSRQETESSHQLFLCKHILESFTNLLHVFLIFLVGCFRCKTYLETGSHTNTTSEQRVFSGSASHVIRCAKSIPQSKGESVCGKALCCKFLEKWCFLASRDTERIRRYTRNSSPSYAFTPLAKNRSLMPQKWIEMSVPCWAEKCRRAI